MTTIEYIDQFNKDVLKNQDGLYINYFNGHRPRFEAQVEMFKGLDSEKIKKVYDIGSWLPFASYYFSLTQNADVKCFCLKEEGLPEVKEPTYKEMNLCTPDKMDKADLVICTECIEHLPCPLRPVIDYLKSITGKYLLLSFPIGGIIKGDFDKDFGNWDIASSPHYREFNPDLIKEFLAIVDYDIVDDKKVYTQAYGGDIHNFLLRKK